MWLKNIIYYEIVKEFNTFQLCVHLFIVFMYCACMRVCMYASMPWCACGGQDHLRESDLSNHHVGPEGQTQVRLGNKSCDSLRPMMHTEFMLSRAFLENTKSSVSQSNNTQENWLCASAEM